MNDIKFKKKKKKKIYKKSKLKLIFTIILFITMIIVFIFTMNSNRFLISSVSVDGNDTILDIDIIRSVNEIINRKKFFIPMNNVLFINKKKIIKKIEDDFPKIYDIEVSIKDSSDLSIKVEERKPYSLWCIYDDKNNYIESISSDFDEECYFSDQYGFIYTKAPYFSSGIFEKIYTTSKSLAIGTNILNKEEFSNFFSFIQSLNENFDIVVNYILIDKYNETRIYIDSLLSSKLLNNPYIIYHTNDNYQLIERNMDLMINNYLFKKDFSDKPNELNFIDLRIDDQIRYKFDLNNKIHD